VVRAGRAGRVVEEDGVAAVDVSVREVAERWLVRGSSMMNWMNSWESGEASALVQVREMRRWEVGVAGVVERRASQSWVESLVCGLDGWELG
jgi:hypothetical protein